MGFAESSNAEGNVQTSSESVSHTQEAAVLHSSTEEFLEMEHAAVTSPAGDGKQTTDEDDFMSWFPEEGVDGVKDVTLTEEDLLLIDDVLKNL